MRGPLPRLRRVNARHVLVLGGASGAGERVVEALLRKGDIPYVLDGSRPLHGVAYEILDLADRRQVKRSVCAFAARPGGLDGLVAAGTHEDQARESWSARMLDVNLLAFASASRAALAPISRAGGTITLVACGPDGPGEAGIRSTCRMGVIGLGRGLAVEGGGRIAVTTLIASGTTDEEQRALASAAIRGLSQRPSSEVYEVIVPAPAHLTLPRRFAAGS